jgi:hypothetical protein
MEDPAEQLYGRQSRQDQKMSIGVGKRTGGTAGGAGTIYVDDIQLIKGKK